MNASTPATHDQAHHPLRPLMQTGGFANGHAGRRQLQGFCNPLFNRLAKWRITWCCLLAGWAMGLAGCASPRLAATVTRFHQWPAATQGASYAIAPATLPVAGAVPATSTGQPVLVHANPHAHSHWAQAQFVALPALEYQTYAAYLEQALQAKGLVPAPRPEQARLVASFAVSVQQGVVQERVLTMRPMLWLGYGGFGWRSGLGMNVFYDDEDWFGWHERMATRPVQSYRLHVTVVDRGQASPGAKGLAARLPATVPTVLEAQAQYTGRPVPLAVVMPYLVRAVFEDFPGVSGQTKQVVFDTQTGERK